MTDYSSDTEKGRLMDQPGPADRDPADVDAFMETTLIRGAVAARNSPEAWTEFIDSDEARSAKLILELETARRRFAENRGPTGNTPGAESPAEELRRDAGQA